MFRFQFCKSTLFSLEHRTLVFKKMFADLLLFAFIAKNPHLGIAGGDNTLEEGVGGVLKLHLHTAQRDLHALNVKVEEVENDGLVGTEGLARADVGKERIANLASGTSDADGKGSLGHVSAQTRNAEHENAKHKHQATHEHSV